MIYLCLAILGCVGMSVSLKVSENAKISYYGMMSVNYFVAMLIAFGIAMGQSGQIQFNGTVLMLGLITGTLYCLTLILCRYNIGKSGAILATTFMQLGVLVPIVLSFVVWREIPSVIQMIGIVLSVLAIILISSNDKKAPKSFVAGLLLLLFSAGFADSMPKFFSTCEMPDNSAGFMFCTFVVSFLICLTLAVFQKEKLSLKILTHGTVLGVTNFCASWFLLLAVAKLPAYLVYPMYSVISIVITAIISMIFFKEKLAKKQWLGMLIVLFSVAFLNLYV